MGALISESIRDEGELVIRVNLLLVYHSQVGGGAISTAQECKENKRTFNGNFLGTAPAQMHLRRTNFEQPPHLLSSHSVSFIYLVVDNLSVVLS